VKRDGGCTNDWRGAGLGAPAAAPHLEDRRRAPRLTRSARAGHQRHPQVRGDQQMFTIGAGYRLDRASNKRQRVGQVLVREGPLRR
jgi:hypothetical protein